MLRDDIGICGWYLVRFFSRFKRDHVWDSSHFQIEKRPNWETWMYLEQHTYHSMSWMDLNVGPWHQNKTWKQRLWMSWQNWTKGDRGDYQQDMQHQCKWIIILDSMSRQSSNFTISVTTRNWSEFCVGLLLTNGLINIFFQCYLLTLPWLERDIYNWGSTTFLDTWKQNPRML